MTRVGLLLLLAAMCASPAPVAAAPQRGGGGHGQRQPPAPRVATTTPSSSLPPSINRPSFPIRTPLGIGPAAPSPFAARPWTYAPRTGRVRGPRAFGIPLGGYGFGTPGFYSGTAANADSIAAGNGAALDDNAGGILFVDATPRSAHVFVDSAYVGTVDDLSAEGVSLTRGRHWLEVEAPEYEKKLVEVNILPGRPLRYRVDLSAARRAELTVISPHPPETMYAIPNCYGGNKPPAASALPSGCDIANLRVIRPQRTN